VKLVTSVTVTGWVVQVGVIVSWYVSNLTNGVSVIVLVFVISIGVVAPFGITVSV
jgi:hypothetical protein